jgi:hypothetical protein
MSLEDLPQLVAAVVHQLDQFVSRLQSILRETGNEGYIRMGYGNSLYHDVDWNLLREILSRRSGVTSDREIE